MRIQLTLLLLLIVSFAFNAESQSAADFTNFTQGSATGFSTNNFRAIGVGKEGHIWAGSQYGGLYKYNPITKIWEKAPILIDVFINDIKTDKDGGIWIAQSGKSGSVGGGSNIDGGVYYFPTTSFAVYHFYSITNNGGLTSRNVRSLWVDSSRTNGPVNPRLWVAQASFITSFNTTRGGVGVGLNSAGNSFNKVTNGIDQTGTPSILSVGGNKDEVWVMAQANYGRSQIIRYSSSVASGVFLGAFDHLTTPGIFSPGFRANAIYFDKDGRKWIGLQAGGVVVEVGGTWFKLNYPPYFPSSVAVNNNAITGDEEGRVYIGTNHGLVIFNGGEVNDVANFERYATQTDGLPDSNVTSIAIDTFDNKIVLATSGGVSFWKPNKKIKVNLDWDYSFLPRPEVKARGVAADGVARLYLKIKRGNDTLPKIKKVSVKSHEYHSVDRSLRGRLKVAFAFNRYSEEASKLTETEVERPDSTDDGNFWFWYVAPEDFSVDDVGGNAEKSERRDNLKIKVTWADNTEDSAIFSVAVVRPPLLLVHGLASNPSSFDGLSHGFGVSDTIKFINSPVFKYKKAITMDPSGEFRKNAIRLLSGDFSDADARANSLQGNIQEFRNLGFAANQVDYVCHSMGGLMIRGAIGWYPHKFFANGEYRFNNYKKGFVHKLITINTPHNSSPLGDAVQELITRAPIPLQISISRAYQLTSSLQMPWDFLKPDDPDFMYYTTWKPSDAVRDLQVNDATGGVNMPVTKGMPAMKNHLIVGDINLTTASINATVSGMVDQKVLAATKKMGTKWYLRIARDYAGLDRDFLTSLLETDLNEAEMFISFFNWYGALKGYPNFAGNGDLIVPLLSQTARQAPPKPHISIFENVMGHGFDAMHIYIMGRLDVGKRVMQLLNSQLSDNPMFADHIDANTDGPPTGRTTSSAFNFNRVVQSFFDTSKIVIDTPLRTGDSTYSDSTLQVTYRLKDTVGLAYINLNFQDNDSFRTNRASMQTIPLKLGMASEGNHLLMVTAVYDKGDSVKYFVDTLNLKVKNLAILQGFRIQESMVQVTGDIGYKPKYEVKYNDEWFDLSGTDPLLQYTLTPAGSIKYDSSAYAFKALADGFTQVIFNYKNFRDTVNIKSLLETPKSNLVFQGKVYLQGAYNAATGNLNTALNSTGILEAHASSQPYEDSISNYYGREKVNTGFFAANSNIVDWVMVELRNSEYPTAIVTSRAAFVKSDGTLADTSGANGITFDAVPLGSYYVVIKHRNHIAVRSSSVINFNNGTGTHDFTTSISSAFQGTVSNPPMATVAPGVYAMWGGDMNSDKQVKMTGFTPDNNDYLKLLNILGGSTNVKNAVYSKYDINMDGNVNMTGMNANINDYLKLLNILGSSTNHITQPAF